MASPPHGTTSRLERLLAHHEQAASAIRMTMELLNGSVKAAKSNGHAAVLADALALDAARVTKQWKKRKIKSQTKAAKLEARQRSAHVLDQFDTKTPRHPGEVARELGYTKFTSMGFGPLVHGGYLKKRKGGYIRTAKPYVVVDAPG